MERSTYSITLPIFDIQLACSKLIEMETGFNPLTDTNLNLEHTYFYNIKFEGFTFECDEGDLEYTYNFSDDGSLERYGNYLE